MATAVMQWCTPEYMAAVCALGKKCWAPGCNLAP